MESYNYFIKHKIDEIIQDIPVCIKTDFDKTEERFMTEYRIKFSPIKIGKPVINEADGIVKPMYPMDGRLRNGLRCTNLFGCDTRDCSLLSKIK